MLFRITAVSPADQLIKATGQWTVEADCVEQAIFRFHRSDLATADLWPAESQWAVEPVEQDRLM